jgi:hypothetical protein
MSDFLPWSERSKKWEPHAVKLRELVPCKRGVPFDPWKLAPHVGLCVIECDFPGLTEEEKAHMSGNASSHWSGGVFAKRLPDGRRICIINPYHDPRRNKVTLMEEISHCHLQHTPTQLTKKGDVRFRDFNRQMEEEAYGVGAAVLLPWSLFFPLLNAGYPVHELADEFAVTTELVMYRIKICGASSLYAARQRKRA